MEARQAPTLPFCRYAPLSSDSLSPDRTFPRGPTEPLSRAGGLVFNLRNVLFDDTAWRRWLLQLVHRMGLHTHYDVFYRCWELEYLPDVRSGSTDYWSALKCYLAAAGMARGQLIEVEAAGRLRRERFHQQIRPFPGVAAALARLHEAGMRLVAVETGSGEVDDPLVPLHQFQLDRWFHAIVSHASVDASEEQRVSLYTEARAAAHLPSEQLAAVSHNSWDLRAAAAAGLGTVAFNAGRDAEADLVLAHFSHLPTLCGVRAEQRRAG